MKRFASILLGIIVICFALTGVPTVSAAEQNYSGVIGDNLDWSFDAKSGKLTISGHGDMPDCMGWEYGWYWTMMPWHYLHIDEKILSIEIKPGVTSIGYNAFGDCFNLRSVSIPNGLYEIGGLAFSECNLRSVRIPESVAVIGTLAFCGCEHLSDVQIENPHGMDIAYDAFDNTAFYEKASNWKDGMLYAGKHLIRGQEDLSGVCTVRPGTVSIASGAFSTSYESGDVRDQITEIILPDSMEFIGRYAFSGCAKLKKIQLPRKGVHIEPDAFSETKLADDKSNWENGYMYIGNYIVGSERGLLDSNNSVRKNAIGKQMYSYVSEIPSDAEIVNCTDYVGSGIHLDPGVTQVTIPASVKRVGSLFSTNETDDITDIFVSEENPYFKSIDGVLYSKDGKILLWYPGGKNERSFTVPDGVEAIGRNAFCRGEYDDKSTLETIILPSSLRIIESGAFDGRKNLKNVSLPNNLQTIECFAFSHTGIESVQFPASLKEIDSSAFYECEYLASAHVPATVQMVGGAAFYACPSLSDFSIADGVMYTGRCGLLYGVISGAAYTENPENWDNGGLYAGSYLLSRDSDGLTIKPGTKYLSDGLFSSSWGDGIQVYIPLSVEYFGKQEVPEGSEFYYEGTQEQWNNVQKWIECYHTDEHGNNPAPIEVPVHFNSRIPYEEETSEAATEAIETEPESMNADEHLDEPADDVVAPRRLSTSVIVIICVAGVAAVSMAVVMAVLVLRKRNSSQDK